MNWKFQKFRAGQLNRWEFLIPPGTATETDAYLADVFGAPFLPGQSIPTGQVFPEKFILEKSNFKQALEILARIPWLTDFRLNLGKYKLDKAFSFDGFESALKDSGLLPSGWSLKLHPQAKGNSSLGREEIQTLWDEHKSSFQDGSLFTELNALCIGHEMILSLSMCGDPLFKRGRFKPLGKSAPVRENLASFLLWRLQQRLSEVDALIVPFAGSGTFVWEGAHRILSLSFPHYKRRFFFQDLLEFPQNTWEFLYSRLLRERSNDHLKIWINELERETWNYLQERKEEYSKYLIDLNSSFALDFSGENSDFFTVNSKIVWESLGEPKNIWIPVNPPYGLRIQTGSNSNFYRKLGRKLSEWKNLPANVVGFVMCPTEQSWSEILNELKKHVETIHVTHGGMDLRVLYF
ncbi:hypothetical protein CH373_17955 [Leptospira perolatii]|uniref:Ribosomal RNA large subunit methyltransferase K/L-like methyltransferase domain-containing protein n=1 Tax=Leptospira perolatii TaxID=2023191 RepID=A0A2M9ZIC1_9LEPT|nr:hypothetical protein [Leptospira perolatii]PJZ68095.1 hypothetical protein CH360_17895 [Leptospira perolatii]PJZ71714.1 hypothetical protein CH373_17955 [Leptospira perolatii]